MESPSFLPLELLLLYILRCQLLLESYLPRSSARSLGPSGDLGSVFAMGAHLSQRISQARRLLLSLLHWPRSQWESRDLEGFLGSVSRGVSRSLSAQAMFKAGHECYRQKKWAINLQALRSLWLTKPKVEIHTITHDPC